MNGDRNIPEGSKNVPERPFTAFNFEIEIKVEGVSEKMCSAAFSECDGLEMTMEPKTLREGGNNARQFHLAGPVSYSTLTLKRGMTSNFDLWKWFIAVQRGLEGRRLRAEADVIVYTSHSTKRDIQMRFHLTRCLPIKLKAPALNAKDGGIAIEEMQIAYETLALKNQAGSR